jgi:hypothetical protein
VPTAAGSLLEDYGHINLTPQRDDLVPDIINPQAVSPTPSSPPSATLQIRQFNAEKTIANYRQNLSQLVKNTHLHKDNFGAGLLAILQQFSSSKSTYDTLVTSLPQLFSDLSDENIIAIYQKIKTDLTIIKRSQRQLLKKIDDLLASFPDGNNWYRLLGAWQILVNPSFHHLVIENSWLETLAKQALELLGDFWRTQILQFPPSSSLVDFFHQYHHHLQQIGVTLTSTQQNQFITFLTPIIQNFIAQNTPSPPNPAPHPSSSIHSQAQEEKINQLNDQLTLLEKQHQRLISEKQKITTQHQQLSDSSSQTITKLQTQIADLNSRNQALTTNLKKAQQDNYLLRQMQNVPQEQFTTLENKFIKLQTKLQESQHFLKQFQLNNEELIIANAALKQENWRLKHINIFPQEQPPPPVSTPEPLSPPTPLSHSLPIFPYTDDAPLTAPDLPPLSSSKSPTPAPVIPLTAKQNRFHSLGLTKNLLNPNFPLAQKTKQVLTFSLIQNQLAQVLGGSLFALERARHPHSN